MWITIDTNARFFDKHYKKMVDTIVAIQREKGALKGAVREIFLRT